MTEHRFRKGDKVTPNPDAYGVPRQTLGRVFTVDRRNPKNLRCTADDGGRGINFPDEILLPATDENVAKGKAALGSAFAPLASAEHFTVGQVVSFKGPRLPAGVSAETPFVVIGEANGKYRIALLGGDEDRYYRIPPMGLTARDLPWVAERLVEGL